MAVTLPGSQGLARARSSAASVSQRRAVGWLQVLRRRSQRHRMRWDRFTASLEPLLPPVQVLHPYPDARFDAKYPHIRGKNRVR